MLASVASGRRARGGGGDGFGGGEGDVGVNVISSIIGRPGEVCYVTHICVCEARAGRGETRPLR